MKDLIELRWHGRGGQGVVTAAKMLAKAKLKEGWYFQAFPDYGPERMGAPVKAFTRLSPTPIHVHSQVQEPDIVLVLDPTLLKTVPVTEGLKADGTLLVNTNADPAELREMLKLDGQRLFVVDASNITLETLGREITNVPMLAALGRATDLVDREILRKEIQKELGAKFGPDVVEGNLAALDRAWEETREG
ncbi:MAG: 2-oxoacid:acceptor oxidoreductase family protein [Anaerolineales bacterium]